MKHKVTRAIKDIELSRSTHVECIEYLRKNKFYRTPRYIGNTKHHRKCIKAYDNVLECLRAYQAAEINDANKR